MGDVLYWKEEAIAFARRAAEAYAAGSTVIIADPGRRRDDFVGALRAELVRLGVEPLPTITLDPVQCPASVQEWVSAEVRTASELFCADPFELVLRPAPRRKHPEAGPNLAVPPQPQPHRAPAIACSGPTSTGKVAPAGCRP